MNPYAQLYGTIILVIVGICALAYYVENKSCDDWSKIGGYESNYSFNSGCWVKLESGWMQTDNLRKN